MFIFAVMNTDDIFEIIEDDLENEVAQMTMIHENPLVMQFSIDTFDLLFDSSILLKELLFICNMFFPKSIIKYDIEKTDETFESLFGYKRPLYKTSVLTFEFPENVFTEVHHTIEFVTFINNAFKGRKYKLSIRNRFATYYFNQDIFVRKHNGKLMTVDVISQFISAFFTTEERQRYAYESYFGVPLDVYAVKGAAYVSTTERYENKYNEMEDITDKVPQVIGKKVAIKNHLIDSARIGVQGGNPTYAHYEPMTADRIHRIVVMSQESNRNPKFATVVMTLSEPYYKKSQNTFNVMYTKSQVVIDNGEMNYHNIVERFLKKVCEHWVFG